MGRLESASTATGPGRAIVAVYAVLALAALGRSVYQIASQYDVAPLAYSLSALAAVVYCVATWALASGRVRAAVAAISFEFIGVLSVGTWSIAEPARFPDDTVWSQYGGGYAWVPLVLPLLGFWWLYTRMSQTPSRP